MSVKPADFVESAARVLGYYGTWPTFHDADYVAIHIDMSGPTVSINFRLYDWDDVADRANRPHIALRWHTVEGLKLSGIQELGQNAIGQMRLTQSDGEILTSIQTAGGGTMMEFSAGRVEVTHFEPHEEWDHEKSNTAPD